ncbi:MAG: hypothetical protein DLM62_08200 [Pseudonocardiales bacterium]|nr:MAG: hypothetical protein DLM62_08200 [Pseudonocardiales bacterium]
MAGWKSAATGADVTLFEVADEVFYAGSIARPGGNAEYQLVDERITGHKPTTLDFAETAALPLTSITAWETLFDRFKVDADSQGTLMVMAGAGGVGSMLIQLALAGCLVEFVSPARPELAYVHFVGVRPDHRRCGVARMRYAAFLDHARASGCHEVRAITAPAMRTQSVSTNVSATS